MIKPGLFKIVHNTAVTHCQKYKNVKAYISGTIKESQKISSDLSSLGSRLGLQEIWSKLKDKKCTLLKNLVNGLTRIS
jgi:hypothetical protein